MVMVNIIVKVQNKNDSTLQSTSKKGGPWFCFCGVVLGQARGSM